MLISVYDVPDVRFLDNPIGICENGERINLNDIVNLRGGIFSGPGVNGNTFNSTGLIPGNYEIEYSFITPRDCEVIITKDIEVLASPIVDAGIDRQVCIDAGLVDLSNYGLPYGGIWSGRSVETGNTFNASGAGIGTHILTYTYQDPVNGCIASDDMEFDVIESLDLDIPSTIVVCNQDNIINLRELDEAPRGATFIGNGVVDGLFYVSIAGTGTHRIAMSVDNGNGCIATVDFNIVVNEVTDIELGEAISICSNERPFDLTAYANVIGGSFVGRGITGSVFDPARAGLGTHVITYTYESESGCIGSDTKVITVNEVVEIDMDKTPIALCLDDGRLPLNTISETRGLWSGNGISGVFFDPVVAGAGDHWITLTTNGLGGCVDKDSVSISVYDSDIVSFTDLPVSICESDNSIDLSSLVNVIGGEFEGPGVNGNLFDPRETGRGRFRVSYTIISGGTCEKTVTKDIDVISLPEVQAGSDVIVCLDSTKLDLTIGAFPTGGYFEGPGVEGNEFNALRAGPGVHRIVYRYKQGDQGCEGSAIKTIEVLNSDRVFAGPDIDICISGMALDLSESVSPKGGVFYGKGVNGNFFYPTASGVGEFKVDYVITSERGCVSTSTRTVRVNEEQELDVGGDLTLCINESPVILDRFVSIPGGTWSGTGVTSNVFDIDSAGIGVHILTYRVFTSDGCELEATKILRVNDVNSIEIGGNLSSCLGGDRINLIGNFNTDFVRISGPGVIGGFEFDPNTAGVGTHAIVYEFLNDNGCVFRDERYITVAANVFVAVDSDFAVCQGAGEIDITDKGYPRGEGIWIGKGVESNVFDPSNLDPGSYQLEYRVDLGYGCTNSAIMTVDVVAGAITGFGRDTILCLNSAEFELNNEMLLGGNWSGPGVINNKFYPSQSGPGEFILQYTNDDFDCDIAGRRKITVVDIPELATVEEYDIGGCRGDVIRLTANIQSNDNTQVINYEWYKEGESENFARGKSINYVLQENENIYFRSVNQFGCTSNQADFIRLTVNGAFGYIEVDQDTVGVGDIIRFKSVVSNAEEYYWNFGDGNFSTESDPIYIYHTTGRKNVSLNLTSPDGCEFLIEEDDFVTVLPDIITGLDQEKHQVNIYPVPVASVLKASVTGRKIAKWQVFDLKGQLINKMTGLKENEVKINMDNVNIGTYMLLLVLDNNEIVVRKITKK